MVSGRGYPGTTVGASLSKGFIALGFNSLGESDGVKAWDASLRFNMAIGGKVLHIEAADQLENIAPELRGHRLPLRRPGSRASRGRALLVGDAAGLVDPLSGDGMYEAFVSARLASAAVLDLLVGRAVSLDEYTTRLAAEIGPLASASWGAKVALDRYPRTLEADRNNSPALPQ